MSLSRKLVDEELVDRYADANGTHRQTSEQCVVVALAPTQPIAVPIKCKTWDEHDIDIPNFDFGRAEPWLFKSHSVELEQVRLIGVH
jgi:hypothetical protein